MKLIMIIGGMAQGKHAYAAQFTHARCIDGLAAQIRDAIRAGRDPLAEANASVRDFVTTRESASSDDLAETQDLVLIYPEVGSGVVPLDPEERAWREAVGRVGCRIAADALQNSAAYRPAHGGLRVGRHVRRVGKAVQRVLRRGGEELA